MQISIITASYNYENYIKETIESVIAQTYPHWEMIIVDDGSKDNSLEVIKSYCEQDSRIKLYQHENGENKGLIETVKLGIEKAQNKWIVFLESDDTITSDYLETKLEIIKQYPDVKFIFNDVNMFGDEDRIQYFEKNYFSKFYKILEEHSFPANISKTFIELNPVPTFSCVMLKKELLVGVDFNVTVKPWLDYYIWAQIAKNNDFYFVNKKLTNWRMHKNSFNSVNPTTSQSYFWQRQLYSVCNKSNLLLEILLFLKFARKEIIRIHFKDKRICILGKWYNFQRKIKLGIAYNLFDGEELLESSLKSVRDCADYICVVYQTISYYGNKANPELESLLNKLKDKGLIDEIYHYNKDFSKIPDKLRLEKEKRDIGLKLCKKHGMTHFLSMDVDEFYDKEQLENAKQFVLEKNIKTSACSLYEYLKKPQYRIIDGYTFQTTGEYNFYCPFIMKIDKFVRQKHNSKFFPTLVDPSRGINNSEKFYLFPVQDIVMHHMSTVRKDLDKKYSNSNINLNLSPEYVAKVKQKKEEILNWEFEKFVFDENKNLAIFSDKIVKKVENKFGIQID